MTDSMPKNDPPTFHANISTSNLNVDEMTMEFRWIAKPHREWMKEGSSVLEIPPATPQEIMAVEPVARVVLTFSAARALKEYLDLAVPQIEKKRKSS